MRSKRSSCDTSILSLSHGITRPRGIERKDAFPSIDTGYLHCLWHTPLDSACLHAFITPEEVHAHVEQEHVGRKTHGNLILQCQWNECKVAIQFSKRCHILAHIKTHLPFSRVSCDLCGLAFKWPADLRKHRLRIHGVHSTMNNSNNARHKQTKSAHDPSLFPSTPMRSFSSSRSPFKMPIELDSLPTSKPLLSSIVKLANQNYSAREAVNVSMFSSTVCKPARWELHSPLDWCEWWPVYQAALQTARNLEN